MSALRVRVWRGGADGRFQEFDVPRLESQTVLDVVTHIQRHLDPTLAYRFACRVGMCGSCAMTVNGIARWTCRTHVSTVVQRDSIEIAPLSNLPVIKGSSRRARVATISPSCVLMMRHGRKPMPGSNASAAACAIRPATS